MRSLSLKQMVENLSRVESLQGKPKILVLQLITNSDREIKLSIPKKEDFYIVCNTLHGQRAYLEPDVGSVFLQKFSVHLREDYMTHPLPRTTASVIEAIQDVTTLTDKVLMRMAREISSAKTHSIAMQYLDIQGHTLETLKEKNQTDPYKNTCDVFITWRDKSKSNNRQRLAELLKKAASEHSLLDIRSVDKVLAVPQGVSKQLPQEINYLTKTLNFSSFYKKTEEGEREVRLTQLMRHLEVELVKSRQAGQETGQIAEQLKSEMIRHEKSRENENKNLELYLEEIRKGSTQPNFTEMKEFLEENKKAAEQREQRMREQMTKLQEDLVKTTKSQEVAVEREQKLSEEMRSLRGQLIQTRDSEKIAMERVQKLKGDMVKLEIELTRSREEQGNMSLFSKIFRD